MKKAEKIQLGPRKSESSGISKLQRLGIIVGVVTGIGGLALSIKTIIFAPAPPKLDVVYSLTHTQSLAVAPLAKDGKTNWSEPFPLPLLVSNAGDKTAEDTYLRLVHPRNIKLMSSRYRLEQTLIFGVGDGRIMSVIRIGSLNPGEKRRMETDILVSVENTVNIQVDAVTKDKKAISFPVSLVLTYSLDVGIGAKDVKEVTSPFYLKIGPLAELKKSENMIFRADDSGFSLLERDKK